MYGQPFFTGLGRGGPSISTSESPGNNFISGQLKSIGSNTVKAISGGLFASALDYFLLSGGKVDFLVAGVPINMTLALGFLTAGALMLQDTVKDNILKPIGIDGKMVDTLGSLSEPLVVGATIWGLNLAIQLTNGTFNISNLYNLQGMAIPFGVGIAATFAADYFGDIAAGMM